MKQMTSQQSVLGIVMAGLCAFGQAGLAQSDEDAGTLPPVIVVNIDVREGLVLLNSTVFGRWEDFVVDELLPFIDAEYRTIPLPQGRALMGHSTGGYGAMMLPLLHPGIWSAVGLNDASVGGGCAEEMFGRGPIGEEFQAIELFADYASLSGVTRARLQIGLAIAPDPDARTATGAQGAPRGGPGGSQVPPGARREGYQKWIKKRTRK